MEHKPNRVPYYTAATTPIIAMAGRKCVVGCATGFWYRTANPKALYLVTNRHVCVQENVEYYPERLIAYYHAPPPSMADAPQATGGPPPVVKQTLPLYDANGAQCWRDFGPDGPDVALVPAAPGTAGDELAAFLPDDGVPDNLILDVGDEVLILGCPEGFYDQGTKLPIVRRGCIATSVAVCYGGDPCFLVDAQVHPGLSGSPVVVSPDIRRVREGHETYMALQGFTVHLLGVLSRHEQAGLARVWRASLIADLATGMPAS